MCNHRLESITPTQIFPNRVDNLYLLADLGHIRLKVVKYRKKKVKGIIVSSKLQFAHFHLCATLGERSTFYYNYYSCSCQKILSSRFSLIILNALVIIIPNALGSSLILRRFLTTDLDLVPCYVGALVRWYQNMSVPTHSLGGEV